MSQSVPQVFKTSDGAYVLLQNEKLYTIYSRPACVGNPSTKDGPFASLLTQLPKRWAWHKISQDTPFTALVPGFFPREPGDFFYPLYQYKWSPKWIETVHVDSGIRFCAAMKLVSAWREIEDFVLNITFYALQIALGPQDRDRIISKVPKPSSFKFYQEFETEDELCIAMEKTFSALHLVAGLYTYAHFMINAYVQECRDKKQNPSIDYHQELSRLSHIRPDEISFIESSKILNRPYPRVGGIVNTQEWSWLTNFNCHRLIFLELAPIIMEWGSPAVYHREWYGENKFFRDHRPPDSVVDDFLRQVGWSRTSASAVCANASNTLQEYHAPPQYPQPVYGSCQRYGETMKYFFQRIAEASKVQEAASKGNKQMRKLIESRRTNAQKGWCPSKARVFFWAPSDEKGYDNWLLRTPAGSGDKRRQIWDEYEPWERRYNPFTNEWDLSHEFDARSDKDDLVSLGFFMYPHFTVADFDDEDGGSSGDDMDMFLPSVHAPAPAPAASASAPQESAIEDSASSSLTTPTDAAFSQTLQKLFTSLVSENADEILQERWGLNERSSDLQNERIDEKSPEVDAIVRTLGLKWLANQQGSNLEVFKCQAVLNEAVSYFRSLQEVNTISFLRESIFYKNPMNLIEDWVYIVRQINHDGKCLFFIQNSTNSNLLKHPSIVVYSAVDVFQLWYFRDETKHMGHVLEMCIRMGLMFNTMTPVDRSTLGPQSEKPGFGHSGLGYRWAGYKLTLEDYRVYQRQRDELLKSPRGRAAVCLGGVIARLAWPVVEYDSLLNGPSVFAADYGLRIDLTSKTSDPILVDDKLTVEEEELIIGTYRVRAAINPDADDGSVYETGITKPSVWPPKGQWPKSNLNIGFWGKDSEGWFLERQKWLSETLTSGSTSSEEEEANSSKPKPAKNWSPILPPKKWKSHFRFRTGPRENFKKFEDLVTPFVAASLCRNG